MAKSGMSESDVESDGDGGKSLETEEKNGCESSESNNSVNVISKYVKVSTPISILIESLVKNLCNIYESDSEKVTMMYNLICDRLFKMNMIDESYNMDEFEGMRAAYQKAFHQLLKSSMGDEKAVAVRPVWPNSDPTNSHYYQEFDEIEYIAGGGFGQVYRVKHKLDGTEYAVKKIPIRAEGIKAVRNYLSEVKTFASVNHANIVQYKAAWLELGAPTSSNTITDESETFTEELKTHIDDDYIYHQNERHSFSDNHKVEDTSDFEVNFEHSIGSINNCSRKSCKREKRNSVSEGGKAICKLDIKEIRELKMQQRARAKWATLYIQMALCQSTLKQWLETRNDSELLVENGDKALISVTAHVRSENIYKVLRQLLKGLEYIHSKGIVHHDIKPSNIFIQIENGNWLVQLGDFGLACPLQNVRHSLAFGTKLYAAPEQLAGKCDPKSDMYSLGIVLFELVERFHTDMERVQYINDLRKEKLPKHVHVQQPQLAQIICQLVSKYPQDRPDASTLLKTISHDCDGDYVQQLECKLAERDEEILRLKELLKSAGVKSI
ncbi:serine/threonine-protein kinase ifkC [Asbolus verrucosus]|uniref:non-specific serine/threonine protein kinase n=1 Tax=Asbolus verrucosus TaxID=1661398 RepID=A0A482VXY1_ASBVE|nr:serine/threonine-protein kinase ifkC [Asbolus verrucosus]